MKANNEMDIIQEAKEWLTHKDDCGNYAKKLGVDYKDHSIEYKLISCLVDRLEEQYQENRNLLIHNKGLSNRLSQAMNGDLGIRVLSGAPLPPVGDK